jgi:predicted permease
MVQSLVRLLAVDPGFKAEHVVTFLTTLSAEQSSSPDRIRAAYQNINDRLSAIPGVEAASVEIGALPLTGNTTLGFWRDGEPRPTSAADRRAALFYAIGPDYFRTMQIPVLRGRTFTRQDDSNHIQVLIIDDELARRVFPNQEAIGNRIRFTGFDRTAEIVGVVGHVKHAGLDLDAAASIRSQLYMPYLQIPDIVAPLTASGITGVVQSHVDTASLFASIKTEVAAVDRGAVVHDERTMTEIIEQSVANRRFTLMLIGTFALLALILSAVGIYAVVSYLVSQRTREIGVRAALGAQRHDVLRLVLGEGQKMALRGIAVGVGGGLILNRLFATLLYGITATDPLTFVSIATLLVTVTLAACYVPARRALRIDPATALRAE